MRKNGTDAAIRKVYRQLYWRKYTHMNEQTAVSFTISLAVFFITACFAFSCSKMEDSSRHKYTQMVIQEDIQNHFKIKEKEFATQIELKNKELLIQCLKMKFKPVECGIK